MIEPSEELLKKIAELKDSLSTAGKMIKECYDLAIRDGFSPIQARQFLTAQLPFLAERTIRLALPEEAKDQNKVRQTVPQNKQPSQPNVVNITTKAEIQDANLVQDESEEPTDLELAQIKIQQLEDALKKSGQFKPASILKPAEEEDDINVVTIKAGIGVIADLIRLEIPKLKNRGWKVIEVKFRAI